jgi:uncharacterized membrane protein YfcA
MVCLTLAYIAFLFIVFHYTKKKIANYERIGYEYEYSLDEPKYFVLICLGGFGGGFMGGVFALGNSMTIIFTLVYMDVEPIVTTAIVGFQVIFFAAASLSQAMANKSLAYNVIGFFILITFIAGGILSFIADKIISRLNRQRVNIALVAIVMSLNIMASLSMLVYIGLSYHFFGPTYMISIESACK